MDSSGRDRSGSTVKQTLNVSLTVLSFVPRRAHFLDEVLRLSEAVLQTGAVPSDLDLRGVLQGFRDAPPGQRVDRCALTWKKEVQIWKLGTTAKDTQQAPRLVGFMEGKAHEEMEEVSGTLDASGEYPQSITEEWTQLFKDQITPYFGKNQVCS